MNKFNKDKTIEKNKVGHLIFDNMCYYEMMINN